MAQCEKSWSKENFIIAKVFCDFKIAFHTKPAKKDVSTG